jgi:hypothetical protein
MMTTNLTTVFDGDVNMNTSTSFFTLERAIRKTALVNMFRAIVTTLISISLISTISMQATNAATTTNPYGAGAVDPAPANQPILVVSKGSKKVSYTYGQLTALKSSTINIYEPFVKARQNFTVIPLIEFFSAVGISGKDKVKTYALNQYTYVDLASKFNSANALLAIKRNGQPIPYDQGGPIRIIFSDHSSFAKKLIAWNWSIATISVE